MFFWSTTVTTLAMFGLPGGTEAIVILLVALLLFGRRLPDVARSFGKSIVEFKKGLHDIKEEVEKTPPQLTPKSDDEEGVAKRSPRLNQTGDASVESGATSTREPVAGGAQGVEK